MHDELEIATALRELDNDQLARMSRSLAWRAGHDRRAGRAQRAAWRDMLRAVLQAERERRDGRADHVADRQHRLRVATATLAARDLVVLITEYRLDAEDHVYQASRPLRQLLLGVVADLKRQSRASRAVAATLVSRVPDAG
jgi:hypothetical protein